MDVVAALNPPLFSWLKPLCPYKTCSYENEKCNVTPDERFYIIFKKWVVILFACNTVQEFKIRGQIYLPLTLEFGFLRKWKHILTFVSLDDTETKLKMNSIYKCILANCKLLIKGVTSLEKAFAWKLFNYFIPALFFECQKFVGRSSV